MKGQKQPENDLSKRPLIRKFVGDPSKPCPLIELQIALLKKGRQKEKRAKKGSKK